MARDNTQFRFTSHKGDSQPYNLSSTSASHYSCAPFIPREDLSCRLSPYGLDSRRRVPDRRLSITPTDGIILLSVLVVDGCLQLSTIGDYRHGDPPSLALTQELAPAQRPYENHAIAATRSPPDAPIPLQCGILGQGVESATLGGHHDNIKALSADLSAC